jgi:hypothetical protein
MDYLYMDTSAILHAYRAGGISLLDKYARLAQAKGLKLVITDVVWDELFVGRKERGPPPEVKPSPKRAALKNWLAANAIELATQERRLIDDFRAGRLAEYVWDDCGERSIVEHLLSKSEPHKSAVFADDTRFHNKLTDWVKNKKIPNIKTVNFDVKKIVFTNPDMLVSACKERLIHIQQYERLVSAFRTHCAPFNKNLPTNYSSTLDGGFREKADVQRLREGKPVKGVRILGAFGRLMAATGIAFVAIDTMTTAAHAATQLRDGDNEGATETVVEFGGRMAGAAIGAEEGVLLGAALGSIVPGLGTTIGAIAGGAIGGVVGATIGEQAAKDVLDAVQGKSHPPIDERLTDSTMHEYREPEVQALQNDLYEAGYSTEEVNYVCGSVNAARDVARPAEGESELHATLSVLAERVMSDVRSVTPDDNATELHDLPATQVVDRDVDAERADGDGATAPPGEVARQPDVESKGVDTVDAGKAAPVGHEAEAREIPPVVPASGNEATSSDGRADQDSVETVPAAQMPDTDRGEAPPNVPADSSAVPAPKPDDANDARAPDGPQAGQPLDDATVSATPPQEMPAAPSEAPGAEPAHRSDAMEPSEQEPRTTGDPTPGGRSENPVGFDVPAAPSSSPLDQSVAGAAPDVDAVPTTSPPPVAVETPANDLRPSPSGDVTGQNGGQAPHEIVDQNPLTDRGAAQPGEDQTGSFGGQPAITANDVPAEPGATEISSPPSGDEALHDEILADLDDVLDDEALATAADETAMEEMSAGLVVSDDQATDAAGLAELEPVLAHESLDNEGVESLVVTGVLLTPLDGTEHSTETSVIPDSDESLQDIAEVVQDETSDTGADEVAIDNLSDELSPPHHEELTAEDVRGGPADPGHEPFWGGDHEPGSHDPYPGDDEPGYGDGNAYGDDDHYGADDEDETASADHGNSNSSDDDDDDE